MCETSAWDRLSFYRKILETSLPELFLKCCQLVDKTLTVAVASKYYTAAVLWLLAEAVYWINCKTYGKYESFTHQNM